MPFQDIDDEDEVTIPKPPSFFERGVRKVFLEDWGLKLLALVITLALWLAVTGQNTPVTLRVSGVQLNFIRHEGLEISNELPSTIEVVLTGSRSKLDRIGPHDLVATVDIAPIVHQSVRSEEGRDVTDVHGNRLLQVDDCLPAGIHR